MTVRPEDVYTDSELVIINHYREKLGLAPVSSEELEKRVLPCPKCGKYRIFASEADKKAAHKGNSNCFHCGQLKRNKTMAQRKKKNTK